MRVPQCIVRISEQKGSPQSPNSPQSPDSPDSADTTDKSIQTLDQMRVLCVSQCVCLCACEYDVCSLTVCLAVCWSVRSSVSCPPVPLSPCPPVPGGCLRDCSWAPSLARSISITSWQKTVEASLSVLSERTASDLMSTESVSM